MDSHHAEAQDLLRCRAIESLSILGRGVCAITETMFILRNVCVVQRLFSIKPMPGNLLLNLLPLKRHLLALWLAIGLEPACPWNWVSVAMPTVFSGDSMGLLWLHCSWHGRQVSFGVHSIANVLLSWLAVHREEACAYEAS
jgi:hypothetical protein